jgi:3',5'-cyclic AMP phosphodiesterase CpdA
MGRGPGHATLLLKMIIAQITDLHIGTEGSLAYGRYDTALSMSRCVDHLVRQRPAPDVVLATGDLVDAGSDEEYRRLQELLAPLRMPVYLIPGNHDDRDALRKAFAGHAYLGRIGEPACYCVAGHPVRLIALDTTVAGETGGALDRRQIDWLEEQLAAAPRQPALIFMHHPPFKTGIARMDEIGLDATSAARFGKILSRHANVELVTCGHVHRGIQVRWHGTTASVCPSTAFQYALNLDGPGLQPSPKEPPAYQLHCWDGNGIVTHTVAVAG